jgi:hypothetical protein
MCPVHTYRGHELGELFDMRKDPHGFTNLWDDRDYAEVRARLLKTALDAAAFATDVGPPRLGGF